MKENLKPWLPHISALLVFLLVSVVYFSPVIEGKRLKQGDIKNFQGMAKEIRDHRQVFEEEPLWTNSMFGGMPAYQIAVQYPGAVLKQVDKLFQLWTPRPVAFVVLYMIGFYILMLSLRINPWLAIAGAIAFGFSSYYFIIIEAGHNTKAHAIGYMAPTLAGMIWAYRGKLLLGGALTALFMALQVQANHVQITYYFGIFAIFYALALAVDAVRNQRLADWVKASGVLLGAVLLGVLCNFASLYNTWEYGKYTTRGQTELTILPSGESNEGIATSGLDREYVTNWSYGISETLSLLIPNANGGASGMIGSDNNHVNKASPQFRQNIAQSNQYWGNQPFTSGPVYVGAVVLYLFLLGLFLLKGPVRWGILAAVVLTIMLSWGKNFMPLTDFFLDYVPGYDKFRAVTIILAITELAIPLLAILCADRLIREPEILQREKKKFLIASGALVGLILLLLLTPTSFIDFISNQENQMFGQQMQQGGQQAAAVSAFLDELEQVRISIFRADALRSLGFVAAGVALLFLLMRGTLTRQMVIGGLFVLFVVDMWSVNKRYLNNEKDRGRYLSWEDPSENLFPHIPSKADLGVAQMEISNPTGLLCMAGEAYTERRPFAEVEKQFQDFVRDTKSNSGIKRRALSKEEEGIARMSALNFKSNYRVLNLNNPFNDGRTPYFHKSVGGYHGAKLKRIQELIDFHLGGEVNRLTQLFGEQPGQAEVFNALARSNMLNMLNTRYIIYHPEADPLPNGAALGSAWLVDEVILVEDADAEILEVGEIYPGTEAVADKRFADYFAGETSFEYDPEASVRLMSYKPNELTYDFNANEPQFVVFSEIYYDAGWQAYLNDEPVDHVRVNYLLRGMKVPAGEHTIVFRFEPAAFSQTASVATVASVLMLLLLAFAGFREFKKRQSLQHEE